MTNAIRPAGRSVQKRSCFFQEPIEGAEEDEVAQTISEVKIMCLLPLFLKLERPKTEAIKTSKLEQIRDCIRMCPEWPVV